MSTNYSHSVNILASSSKEKPFIMHIDDDLIDILRETILDINRDISLSNSFVDEEEYQLFNEREIIDYIKSQNYDSHWLMCIKKEVFVGQITNKWLNLSILGVIKLYDESKRKIIRVNKNRYNTIQDNEDWHRDPNKQQYFPEKYIFIWDDKIKHIIHCNHQHFLFIASKIIDKINEIKLKNNEYPLFDRYRILLFLQRININGLLFKSIHHDTFIKCIQYSMIQLSPNINTITIQNLTDETPIKYAQLFYDEINKFDVTTIASQSICTLILNLNKMAKRMDSISTTNTFPDVLKTNNINNDTVYNERKEEIINQRDALSIFNKSDLDEIANTMKTFRMSWVNIANCVHQEMYPMLASAIKSIINVNDNDNVSQYQCLFLDYIL